jgi:hypothetical protein
LHISTMFVFVSYIRKHNIYHTYLFHTHSYLGVNAHDSTFISRLNEAWTLSLNCHSTRKLRQKMFWVVDQRWCSTQGYTRQVNLRKFFINCLRSRNKKSDDLLPKLPKNNKSLKGSTKPLLWKHNRKVIRSRSLDRELCTTPALSKFRAPRVA